MYRYLNTKPRHTSHKPYCVRFTQYSDYLHNYKKHHWPNASYYLYIIDYHSVTYRVQAYFFNVSGTKLVLLHNQIFNPQNKRYENLISYY